MKVYVVEFSFSDQDSFSPVFHEDCFYIARHHAFALMKRLRKEQNPGRAYKYRVRPYSRVEPAPRKKASSGKEKSRA